MTAAIDLYDPDTYIVGPPHEWFAEMRRVQPVYWQDIPRQAGYWALLKHADCVHVAKNPLLFSAETGGVVLETLSDSMLELMRGQLLAMDPPRHPDYRSRRTSRPRSSPGSSRRSVRCVAASWPMPRRRVSSTT
jgi:cytochrome P450